MSSSKRFALPELLAIAKSGTKNSGAKLLELVEPSESKASGIKNKLTAYTDNAKLNRLLLGDLLLEGRISFDTDSASPIRDELAKLTAQTAEQANKIDTQHSELRRSVEFTQSLLDDSMKATQELRQELGAIKRSHQPQQTPTADSCGLLVSGFVTEEDSGQDMVVKLQQFLIHEVSPAVAIAVKEVHRMGKYQEGKGDRRVKVVLGSPAQAEAVLRSAWQLRDFNATRKEHGIRPVGLDQFLSKEDLARKQQLRPKWEEARKKRAPKTFWRGCRLFVEGQEVLP